MTGTITRRRGRPPKIYDTHVPHIRRLYWDDGKTIAYIAGLYGYSPPGMRKWMAVHGIPRRPRTGHAGGVASVKYLREYNDERTRKAAQVQIARVRAALDKLGSEAHPADSAAGRLRIAHPGDSLTELGSRAGVTKDVIAGRLRRLLAASEEAGQ